MSRVTVDSINEALSRAWPDSGYRCTYVSATQAEAEGSLDGISLRPGGFVPGPVQFAMADVALWYLAFGALDRVEPMALTTELSIRFLRPGVGSTIRARAVLDRHGRTAVVGTVRVWTDDNEDRPCATAQGTYALPREA